MDIQLFLAHADDHQPVLAGGLPLSAAIGAPVAPVPEGKRRDLAKAPDALPEQRWALIAPKGEAGDRLLDLVAPLRERREEEQEREALIYRVDPGMDPAAASAWALNEFWDKVNRRQDLLPRYLLVLGGPDQVSWELQQTLGVDAYVGRLAFDADEGYEAYVEKARRCEHEELVPGARAIFSTVRDGTHATAEGYRHLMQPTLSIARERMASHDFLATQIVELGGGSGGLPTAEELKAQAAQMLAEAGRSPAGLLFSMSHGVGAPRAGWPSREEQRLHQGDLVMSRADRLTAGDVAARPFLDGGAWFVFACYGAGTPSRSAYYPWLDQLHRSGYTGSAKSVLAGLPKDGEPPFVAALPQAALANPRGPLGVVGHVDLAWTWGFLDSVLSSTGSTSRPRAKRFQEVLRFLVNGHRLGLAHHQLSRFLYSVSVELLSHYEQSANAGGPPGGDAASEARKVRQAVLWMQRQDLAAYVLLGDPAARMPIAHRPAGVPGPGPSRRAASVRRAIEAPEAARSPAEAPQVKRMVNIVREVLGGAQVGVVAARYGEAEVEVQRWVDTFVDAGSAALAKLV